ncbi:MAG: DUF4349 domain-containing protein [Sphingobacteriaceae bacterium]
MKTISKIYLLGLAMALLQGCGANYEKSKQEEAAMNAMADSVSSPLVPSVASKVTQIDSLRKFIRTADIKFKVKNVERSTYRIEDIINSSKGFVINTRLNSRINYTNEFRIKEDSVLKRTYFTVENYITFRLPNTLLDTTLKQIASQIDYLDHRMIKAEDVSFKALKNKLSEKRFNKHEQRLTKAINSNKTKDVVDAENNLFSKQEQADENAIANLELNDQIEFSTVELLIYQDEQMTQEKLFSEFKQPSYKPSFGKEFTESVKFGWELIEFIFLMIVKIWPVILIVLGLLYFIKRLGSKSK